MDSNDEASPSVLVGAVKVAHAQRQVRYEWQVDGRQQQTNSSGMFHGPSAPSHSGRAVSLQYLPIMVASRVKQASPGSV